MAHGIANQATTVMIRARAAITMIAHSVIQIANGTRRFRCMFGQIKRGEVFYTTQKTSRAREPRARIGHDAPMADHPHTLSPDHREIIDLVYYQEKSVEDCALILGVPAATVKTRMFYARKKLAELVQAEAR